jgi:hypothetical protein
MLSVMAAFPLSWPMFPGLFGTSSPGGATALHNYFTPAGA